MVWIQIKTKKRPLKIKTIIRARTPADEHVDGEAGGASVDDDQQRVQVQTLHQQPEEVGHDEVVGEHQADLTAHLQQQQQQQQHASLHYYV